MMNWEKEGKILIKVEIGKKPRKVIDQWFSKEKEPTK